MDAVTLLQALAVGVTTGLPVALAVLRKAERALDKVDRCVTALERIAVQLEARTTPPASEALDVDDCESTAPRPQLVSAIG